MNKYVESVAWTRQPPWQGQGQELPEGATVKQMLKAAKLDWSVDKVPLDFLGNDKKRHTFPNRFGLVRSSDNRGLGICGDTYKPVQNADALDFFDKFVKSNAMNLETAGSLNHGKCIWGLASINKDFNVGRDDKVSSYLLLLQPHQPGQAMVIQYMAMRERCWNSLTRLLGGFGHKRSEGDHGFRMPHTMVFDTVMKEKAAIALKLAVKEAGEFKAVAQQMAKTKLTGTAVDEYFFEVLQFDPEDDMVPTLKNGEVRKPQLFAKFEDALVHAPGQDISSAQGTLWGAFNAVTATVDHNRGKDRSRALGNAWRGHGAKLKRRALDAAIQRMK